MHLAVGAALVARKLAPMSNALLPSHRESRMRRYAQMPVARPRYDSAMNEDTDSNIVGDDAPVGADEEIKTWWRRSPDLAAGAALAIGLGTFWFGGMLSRVPLDSHATLGYLLMLPLLLIVPAFSAVGLRLSWLAMQGRTAKWRGAIGLAIIAATAANVAAIGRFGGALLRIFTN
ncbi:MAG: hypothetical protein ABI771_08805 [Betaproteobacteria bacterium]